tara:strand:+ start:51 stop:755 length:705 start_codon:yes stop_codon:yes gene_type:complete
MRYELKRNKNGILTQCETNADGGNIYAQREEINKIALENLKRPTPGKLGNLSNLQLFNFRISAITTGTASLIFQEYNTGSTFPANVTQAIQFGVDSLNNKALYYNILDIKATVNNGGTTNFQLQEDSYIEFYITQNNETSTSSLGTKIPQPAPLFGSGGGAVTFTTDGNEFGNQSVQVSIGDDSVNIPSNTNGLRASGLALKTIALTFDAGETTDDFYIDVSVYVDVSSVSSTY